MIRKRLLSACLALALCLSLLPVTALAANGGTVYVGGVMLSGSTDSPAYATTDDNGTVTTVDASADKYNIKWDGSTLTLDGAKIKGGTSSESLYATVGIYAFSNSGDVSLNIALKGVNEIFDSSHGIWVYSSSSGTASLDITGENGSTLIASGSSSGILVQSNSGEATLTIQNADVTAENSSSSGDGVTVRAGSSSSASLSVDGGSLTATGKNEDCAGIRYTFGSSSFGSGKPSLTVSGNTIVRANGGISDNSSTDIQIGGDNNSSGGIVFDGNEGTVYGSVTLQENLTIGEGERLNIPSGASLTIDSGATLTNEGTVTTTDGGTLTNEGTINNSGTLTGTISGNAPPSITTTSLDDGTENTAYNATLEASGNPTSWKITDGSLPAGLTLDESTGVISGTPTAQSTSNFTVTATNDYGSDSKEFTLTIDQQGTIHVTSVSLDKTSLELTEGETAQLTATVEPEDASNKNVTWESSNTNVATVNNGEVTAVSAGTATITATTVDQSKTATCEVTVKPAEYTVTVLTDGKGSASASPATAAAGTTVTLTAKPDSGYRLAHWEVVEGDVTISGNSFTMPAENVTVRAVFSPVVNIPDTYDIDLIVGEGGEAKLSLTNASAGSTITVTATPDEGFKLDYITVDGERIDGTTFTMPNHDVTVRVYFTDGAALPFTDVSAGAWYFDAVGYVYVGGLMDGVSDTLFDPDGTMTRAMVWAILARVDGETVSGDGWIETARDWAMANGVSDGENANGYVTREQFATMLWRYAGEPETDGSGVGVFDDGETVSIWAFDAMSWALNNGVITGVSDDALLPANTATRAQCAAMLMRFVEAIG